MIELALKDLKLFIRDRKAIFLTFLLPIALISLFTLAYGGILSKSTPQPEKLLVCDNDSSALSIRLGERLTEIDGTVMESTDTATGADLIRRGKRLAMVYFGEGFSDSVQSGGPLPLQLWYDEGREIETGMLNEAVMARLAPEIEQIRNQQKISKFLTERYASMGPDFIKQLSGDIDEMISEGGNSSVLSHRKLSGKEDVNYGLIQAVAGVAVMMLLFSVAGIGGSILSERESGTLKRLLVSPLQAEMILGGKLVYALVIALLQLLVMFIFAWLAFGLNIWDAPLSLGLTILATALACSSFGIFLASISQSRKQLEGLSTILILIMSAMGGSMIPLFLMPRIMQDIAVVSVNYWSIQAFFDIFARDAGFLAVLWKAGILTGIAAFLMILSAFFFRKNILRFN